MGNKFEDLHKFFKENRLARNCRATNKNGGEVIRLNQNARTSLEQMHAVSQISKRALASYAISLLNDEFQDWLKGNPESKFGYDVEVISNETD